MLVSVTVLSLNRLEYLRRTVRSLELLPDDEGIEYEFIIVDNGSTCPGTLRFIQGLNGWSRIFNKVNRGIGAGMNQLFEAASGDAVLHIEDDFECLRSGPWLSEGLWLLDHRPGIIQVQLRDRLDPVLRVSRRIIDHTVLVNEEKFHIHKASKSSIVWSNQAHLALTDRLRVLHPFPEEQVRGRQERLVDALARENGFKSAMLVDGAFRHIGVKQVTSIGSISGFHTPGVRKALDNTPVNLVDLRSAWEGQCQIE
jgi:hypothetical protein